MDAKSSWCPSTSTSCRRFRFLFFILCLVLNLHVATKSLRPTTTQRRGSLINYLKYLLLFDPLTLFSKCFPSNILSSHHHHRICERRLSQGLNVAYSFMENMNPQLSLSPHRGKHGEQSLAVARKGKFISIAPHRTQALLTVFNRWKECQWKRSNKIYKNMIFIKVKDIK